MRPRRTTRAAHETIQHSHPHSTSPRKARSSPVAKVGAGAASSSVGSGSRLAAARAAPLTDSVAAAAGSGAAFWWSRNCGAERGGGERPKRMPKEGESRGANDVVGSGGAAAWQRQSVRRSSRSGKQVMPAHPSRQEGRAKSGATMPPARQASRPGTQSLTLGAPLRAALLMRGERRGGSRCRHAEGKKRCIYPSVR